MKPVLILTLKSHCYLLCIEKKQQQLGSLLHTGHSGAPNVGVPKGYICLLGEIVFPSGWEIFSVWLGYFSFCCGY